jgi:hypothetical protein
MLVGGLQVQHCRGAVIDGLGLRSPPPTLLRVVGHQSLNLQVWAKKNLRASSSCGTLALAKTPRGSIDAQQPRRFATTSAIRAPSRSDTQCECSSYLSLLP